MARALRERWLSVQGIAPPGGNARAGRVVKVVMAAGCRWRGGEEALRWVGVVVVWGGGGVEVTQWPHIRQTPSNIRKYIRSP